MGDRGRGQVGFIGPVVGSEGGADGFEAYPEAGAFVAEDWAPSAGTVETAAGRTADDVGAGSGDDEDSRASGEGCVQGDLFVAEEDEFAGDFRVDGGGGPGADGWDREAR